MNDQLKISLSAMVDGEADELEFRRVMKAIEGASELEATAILQQWQRYQMISAGLRNDLSGSLASDDFASQFSRARREEDDLADAYEVTANSQTKATVSECAEPDQVAVPAMSGTDNTPIQDGMGTLPWRRFAVAASVALAVVVGVQEIDLSNTQTGLNVAQSTQQSTDATNSPSMFTANSVQARLDSARVASLQSESSMSQSDSSGLLPVGVEELESISAAEAQKRLNDYLLRHANNAAQQGGQGVIPFTRLANFEDE